MKKITFIFFLASFSLFAREKPVTGHVDMQVHLTTHMVYPHFVGRMSPLSPLPQKKFSHSHTYSQTAFESQLWESSTTLYIITAVDDVFHQGRGDTQKIMKEQFDFIKELVQKFPHHYEIAKTPKEARRIIHSGKKAFVLAIEGSPGMLRSKQDAQDLADEGIAMVGIIHLQDNEYGSTSLFGGPLKLLNAGSIISAWFGCRKKGLSSKGKRAVRWLAEAGVLTDVNHMDDESVLGTIKVAESLGVPVVATHTGLRSMTLEEHDLTDEMVKRIYHLGGIVALTSGHPSFAEESYQGKLPKDYCKGSYQELGLQSNYMKKLLKPFGEYSIAFATDMNGMLNHYRPKYGKKGCFHKKAREGDFISSENRFLDSFDVEGLSHIGRVKDVWGNLERDGYDTKPFMNSAEGFLKVWEKILDFKNHQ